MLYVVARSSVARVLSGKRSDASSFQLRCEITLDGASLTAVFREDTHQAAVRVENHTSFPIEFHEVWARCR